MSLSIPKLSRIALHHRVIECHGFQREDGLWDIEGHLIDTKTQPFPTDSRGVLPPGEPLHEMWLRITIDDNFLIHAVEAVIDAAPFAICDRIVSRFQLLKGLYIRRGWKKQIQKLLGGINGCTHLSALLLPIATTAFQTIYPTARQEAELRAEAYPAEPPMLNSCHALATDSPVVKKHWPKFHTE